MLDEYTFSSIEMLRQKINVFFHAKNQPLVGFQGRFENFEEVDTLCVGGGTKTLAYLKK